MNTLNLNETVHVKTEFIGRRNKRKMRKKEKFFKSLSFIKRRFCGISSVYIILALVCYILISQIKLNNALTNIQKDVLIPRYAIDRIVDYLD